jgi:hypothetical protein
MAVSSQLAAELKTALGNLREARAKNPKHGTIADAPDCDDRCQVCFNDVYLNYLIDQIPRKPPAPSWYDQAAKDWNSNGSIR